MADEREQPRLGGISVEDWREQRRLLRGEEQASPEVEVSPDMLEEGLAVLNAPMEAGLAGKWDWEGRGEALRSGPMGTGTFAMSFINNLLGHGERAADRYVPILQSIADANRNPFLDPTALAGQKLLENPVSSLAGLINPESAALSANSFLRRGASFSREGMNAIRGLRPAEEAIAPGTHQALNLIQRSTNRLGAEGAGQLADEMSEIALAREEVAGGANLESAVDVLPPSVRGEGERLLSTAMKADRSGEGAGSLVLARNARRREIRGDTLNEGARHILNTSDENFDAILGRIDREKGEAAMEAWDNLEGYLVPEETVLEEMLPILETPYGRDALARARTSVENGIPAGDFVEEDLEAIRQLERVLADPDEYEGYVNLSYRTADHIKKEMDKLVTGPVNDTYGGIDQTTGRFNLTPNGRIVNNARRQFRDILSENSDIYRNYLSDIASQSEIEAAMQRGAKALDQRPGMLEESLADDNPAVRDAEVIGLMEELSRRFNTSDTRNVAGQILTNGNTRRALRAIIRDDAVYDDMITYLANMDEVTTNQARLGTPSRRGNQFTAERFASGEVQDSSMMDEAFMQYLTGRHGRGFRAAIGDFFDRVASGVAAKGWRAFRQPGIDNSNVNYRVGRLLTESMEGQDLELINLLRERARAGELAMSEAASALAMQGFTDGEALAMSTYIMAPANAETVEENIEDVTSQLRPAPEE